MRCEFLKDLTPIMKLLRTSWPLKTGNILSYHFHDFFLAFNNVAKQPIIEHIYLINHTFTNKIGVHAFFFVMD